MSSLPLRPYTLVLFLGVIAAGLMPGQPQAEESGLYKIGKLTAYARYCGHHELVSEFQGRYGEYEDFRRGRQKNDLRRYDSVRIACGRLEKNLEVVLEKLRADEAE